MNEQEIDAEITRIVWEAVPEIKTKYYSICSAHREQDMSCNLCLSIGECLQLADVLLATESVYEHRDGIRALIDSECDRDTLMIIGHWNLKLPYHQQSLECKQFIYQLLKP